MSLRSISRIGCALFAAYMTAVVVGCTYQPYVHVNTWLIRDNAVPQYFADYDVFLIHRAGFDWEYHDSRMVALYDYAKMRVKEPFGRKVRVFAPLLHDDVAVDESKLALKYYLDTFHDPGRPFAVLSEGRDAQFVTNFVRSCRRLLDRDNGFAFSLYVTNETLVATNALISAVARSVDDLIYERHWHRQHPPEDLSKAIDIDTLANLPVEVLTDDAPSLRDSNKRVPLKYRSSTNLTDNAAGAPAEPEQEWKEPVYEEKKTPVAPPKNLFEMTLDDLATDLGVKRTAPADGETPGEGEAGGKGDARENDEGRENDEDEADGSGPKRFVPPGVKDVAPTDPKPIDAKPIDTTPVDAVAATLMRAEREAENAANAGVTPSVDSVIGIGTPEAQMALPDQSEFSGEWQ